MALERGDVVTAAVHILDEYGMADLSMRRLAESLGVKAGALYWHVANKQTLLALVADEVLAEVSVPSPAEEPASAIAGWAAALRRVLLGHRDSAELVATALASGLCTVDPLTRVRAMLRDRTGSDEEADWGAEALLHLVLGHVAAEQNVELFSQLGLLRVPRRQPRELDAGFAHGVDRLVRGLMLDVTE